MNRVRQAVIMVGGKGTRLRPLTDNRPKPILPVLDKPCLSYLIESFARGGIEEIILACGYKSEKMANAIGDGTAEGISIEYAYENVPMGTGGAIKLLEDRLDDVFVAANGDVFAELDLRSEIDAHIKTGSAVTISLTEVENPCEFGIARVTDDGRILEFKEKPKPEEVFSNLINAGVYVVNKSVLNFVPKDVMYDFSKDLVPFLLKNDYRIHGHRMNGIWMDVGRPSDLFGANITAATRYGGKYDIPGCKISGPFYLGQGSKLSSSNVDSSVILRSSDVSGSELKDSLIMAGSNISGATVINSIIGENCKLGQGVKVINSILADGTVIDGSTECIGCRGISNE